MPQQTPGEIMIALNVLLAVTGFLSVFLLNAIWKGQREMTKTIAIVLERLSAAEVRMAGHERIIERVDRCRDCPKGGER
jgi:hypothetical protein